MKVVDASVVLTYLLKEGKVGILKKILSSGNNIVPDWMFVEVANTLATKTNINESEAKYIFELVYELALENKSIDRKILSEAMVEAKKYKVAVYDMIYAVMARKLKCKLVTADANFAKKTGFSWVEVI